MSTPPFSNGDRSGGASSRRSRRRTRSRPSSRCSGRSCSPTATTTRSSSRRACGRRTSTASATGSSTSRCSSSTTRASRSTSLTVTEHLRARGKLDEAGGQARDRRARRPRVPVGRQPPPLRADRHASTRSCAACSTRPTRSRPRSTTTRPPPREIVERAEKRDARGRPRRPPEGLPRRRRDPPRRDRQDGSSSRPRARR